MMCGDREGGDLWAELTMPSQSVLILTTCDIVIESNGDEFSGSCHVCW